MKNAIETRRFEQPDDALNMQEFGGISIIKMADGTTGMHAIFEPGWTWEKDEKPLLGHPASCPMSHTGYCLGGNLVVRMVDTNVETRISKGDFFEIPVGHDAYVDGNERVELILFVAPDHPHEPAAHRPRPLRRAIAGDGEALRAADACQRGPR